MQFLYDFFPIIIFFIVFKFAGIYAATAIAIIVALVQVLVYRAQHQKFSNMQLVTCALILVLGGATLILHNPIFIKWKPTIIYWLFALVFWGSHIIGKKPLIRYMMDKKITLPDKIWKQLNLSWVIFFTILGCINLYVIYSFSTNTWVDFKLFGILGATIIFVVVQALYLAKYAKEEPTQS